MGRGGGWKIPDEKRPPEASPAALLNGWLPGAGQLPGFRGDEIAQSDKIEKLETMPVDLPLRVADHLQGESDILQGVAPWQQDGVLEDEPELVIRSGLIHRSTAD